MYVYSKEDLLGRTVEDGAYVVYNQGIYQVRGFSKNGRLRLWNVDWKRAQSKLKPACDCVIVPDKDITFYLLKTH